MNALKLSRGTTKQSELTIVTASVQLLIYPCSTEMYWKYYLNFSFNPYPANVENMVSS
jgi:hypothetical protein